MTESLAKAIAEELNGKAEHVGGNLWVVVFSRCDGCLAVLSHDGAAKYADRQAWDRRDPEMSMIAFD